MNDWLPTLDDFVTEALTQERARRNSHVIYPGFERLYVRISSRDLVGSGRRPVIDLANMRANQPGKGNFRTLVRHLKERWPEMPIYVENVLTDKFCEGLRRMGFAETGDPSLPCFYLMPGVAMAELDPKDDK